MHEVSLCEGIVQILEQEASRQGFSRVRQVWLEIGTLANVEIDALRFAFDVVRRGTLAEQATLAIIERPASGWCPTCSRWVTISQRFDPCPGCGAFPLEAVEGDDMQIKDLEVE